MCIRDRSWNCTKNVDIFVVFVPWFMYSCLVGWLITVDYRIVFMLVLIPVLNNLLIQINIIFVIHIHICTQSSYASLIY